ncbi:GMC oxidoreductase [Parvularcula lutaonensis]|uniref:GMC oxidoreductase n=1 Tax=Parvularcula lutaonensis TaxID=491923 RepID=A0ABV7M9A4_9PROT|nr:GMC family oxidoreductase [Parvularcula lutaonensis]GGY41866.1 dehydrogenase [Parvularcula lutaonensis]
MLRDFGTVEPGSLSGPYDLCVAGTGPAGMTVALKVAAAGGRVLLLEGGGLGPTPESRAVYEGRNVGTVPYGHIETCRLRQFGGTSGHWAGRCAIFDRVDFEQRDIFDLPGWPISYDETYRHLDEAKSILDIPDAELTLEPATPWAEGPFRIGAYAMSPPTRFGVKYKAELEASGNIDCLYNANVTDLRLDENGERISAVVITGYDGREEIVEAAEFVIAFGAMENARFLLNANTQRTEGLGNQNDMVGRTFMEHFNVDFGKVLTTDERFWSEFVEEDGRTPPLMPTVAKMQDADIGNGIITMISAAQQRYYGRLAPYREARRAIICGVKPLRARVQENDSSLTCKDEYFIGTLTEQVPNRESRILVDPDDRDQFGKPKLLLQYEVTDQDWKTIESHAFELGKLLAGKDIARLRVREGLLDRTIGVGAHCHHMGTTRMSDDAKDGVVDKDCRVHGIPNLYMAGASVFPTGGGVNPTLTLVSLAVRLGEHLNAKAGRL